MKVAYYIGSLNQGGTEALTLDICRNWKIAPYRFVCIHRKGGNLEKEFLDTGIHLQHIPCTNNWIKHIVNLRRYLQKEHIDIIHAQTSLSSLYAILATRKTNIKLVTSFHGTGFSRSPKLFQTIIFKKSDRLIFVSEQTLNIYRESNPHLPQDKCKVIYNGISFDRIAIKPPTTNGINEFQLGMVGSFRPERNQIFVCQFLKRLKDLGIPFHFYFVGGKCAGEEQCYIECVQYCEIHGLNENVTFMGARNDVPQLLQKWDAYIYATHFDTFGISIAEAIAAGLPTFVNDWPVADEITQNGRLAYIYKSGDIDDLFSKFQTLVHSQQIITQKAILNATEIRKTFSIEQHICNLYSTYQGCISTSEN